MKYLNLDPSFEPFGASIDFEAFTFNGGEPHLKVKTTLEEMKAVTITARIRSFNDVGFILLAQDALKRMDIQRIELFIPYFPAARQDRVMIPGEPLSVKIYANLINAANFDQVTIFDPHSEVTAALLNNVRVIDNHAFVAACLKDHQNVQLIAPDGGALKKIYKVAQALGGVSVIECSKRRDVHTGKLSGFTAYTDDLQQQTCVIVDDICDGGGTFLGLAKELKNKNAGDIILVISHGIFSKGFEELSQHFTKIYTTDSFNTIKDSAIKQLALGDIYQLKSW